MSIASAAGTLWGGDQQPRKPRPQDPAPPVRHDAPDTSREAAKRTGATSKANRVRIMRAMAAQPRERGLTCYEAQVQLDLLPQTASGRFSELKRMRLIEPTGGKRETSTGSKAAAFRLTLAGERALRAEA
jgi:hypothetical protein